MSNSQQPNLGCPGQGAHDALDSVDHELPVSQFSEKPVARPAAKVGRVSMVKPCAMCREEQPTARLEDPVAFAQVPIQVPDVFQNLKRHDSVGEIVRQVDPSTWLEKNIWLSPEIATDVPALLRLKERLVRAVATAHVHHDMRIVG